MCERVREPHLNRYSFTSPACSLFFFIKKYNISVYHFALAVKQTEPQKQRAFKAPAGIKRALPNILPLFGALQWKVSEWVNTSQQGRLSRCRFYSWIEQMQNMLINHFKRINNLCLHISKYQKRKLSQLLAHCTQHLQSQICEHFLKGSNFRLCR